MWTNSALFWSSLLSTWLVIAKPTENNGQPYLRQTRGLSVEQSSLIPRNDQLRNDQAISNSDSHLLTTFNSRHKKHKHKTKHQRSQALVARVEAVKSVARDVASTTTTNGGQQCGVSLNQTQVSGGSSPNSEQSSKRKRAMDGSGSVGVDDSLIQVSRWMTFAAIDCVAAIEAMEEVKPCVVACSSIGYVDDFEFGSHLAIFRIGSPASLVIKENDAKSASLGFSLPSGQRSTSLGSIDLLQPGYEITQSPDHLINPSNPQLLRTVVSHNRHPRQDYHRHRVEGELDVVLVGSFHLNEPLTTSKSYFGSLSSPFGFSWINPGLEHVEIVHFDLTQRRESTRVPNQKWGLFRRSPSLTRRRLPKLGGFINIAQSISKATTKASFDPEKPNFHQQITALRTNLKKTAEAQQRKLKVALQKLDLAKVAGDNNNLANVLGDNNNCHVQSGLTSSPFFTGSGTGQIAPGAGASASSQSTTGQSPPDANNGQNPQDPNSGQNPPDPNSVQVPPNPSSVQNTPDPNSSTNPPDTNNVQNPQDPNSGQNPPDPNSVQIPPDPSSGQNPPDPNSVQVPPDPSSGQNPPDASQVSQTDPAQSQEQNDPNLPANQKSANTQAPPPTAAESNSDTTSPAPAAAAESASSTAFQLPGRNIKVLPVGLAVFGGIALFGLLIVGWMTYERRKYKKQYRERKQQMMRQANPSGA